MAPKEKIKQDLNEAVKKKEELISSVLRMLLAAVLNKEKEKRYKLKEEKDVQLTDEETIEVIASEAKKRKESIAEFEKGGREDLVKKEKEELDILQKYLPKQLSEDEIKNLAREAIAALRASLAPEERDRVGAKEQKDMGKVMGVLMPQIKGRADGNLVSQIIKELLSKSV